MKPYVGTKLINAEPMTRQAYNDFRGWQLPEGENGSDPGYLVEYVDGGKGNTALYAGYVSWSPADVFARAYRPLLELTAEQARGLAPHQQRVVMEKAELDEKVTALSAFIGHSSVFDTLDAAEQERLKEQNDVMWLYSEILGKRIAAFGGSE